MKTSSPICGLCDLPSISIWGQQELADCLKTNQSSISRRINQAVQVGLLTPERIKESYKLAKEKEIEFDDGDF